MTVTKTEALKQARNSLCDIDNALFAEGKRTPAYVEQAIAAIDAALAEPEWLPIASAPKDGTPILGLCRHSADAYYEENRLTDYGARVEGLSHVEDGVHVLVWDESYEVSDGWENPSVTIPAGWNLSHDPEVGANPTHWQPLPKDPA